MFVDDVLDPPWTAMSDAEMAEVAAMFAAEHATVPVAPPSGFLALELDAATDDAAALSEADLIDAAVGFERLAAWASARQFRVLAEFARRRPAAEPAVGPVDRWAPDEIGLALTTSHGSAAIRLAHAVQLDGPLTATREALEAGLLDASRVRLICDAVAPLDTEKVAAVQARVLPKAPGQTWSQLRSALRRAVLAVDAEGAARRHEKAKAVRRVEVFESDDGMATFWARMTAPDAAASFEWVTRLARGMGADDPRGLDARRSDLVVAALTGRLVVTDGSADDTLSSTPVTPGKPLITVVVPHSTLIGADDEPCEIAGYGSIPAHLARDIAADAVWRRLVTDPLSGALLDYGRTTYRPPAALADFVRGRDVTCRKPGCRRAAAACELDHAIPWGDGHGGATSEPNLWAGCTRDHDLKEQPGWQVILHPDRRMEWITPTGHRYWSEPFDYRLSSPPPSGDDPPLLI